MSVRRQYSAEFRVEAVRLLRERIAGGDSVSRIGQELDVKPDMLRGWAREVDAAPDGARPQEIFPGKGNYRQYAPREVKRAEVDAESSEEELRRLRRENDLLRRERDFLKKAAAFFAKESQ